MAKYATRDFQCMIMPFERYVDLRTALTDAIYALDLILKIHDNPLQQSHPINLDPQAYRQVRNAMDTLIAWRLGRSVEE